MEETGKLNLKIYFGSEYEKVEVDKEIVENFRDFIRSNDKIDFSFVKEDRLLVVIKSAITHFEVIDIEPEKEFDIDAWKIVYGL